ncbi:hypothetical protein [Alkalihalobacillus sp. LMS39]|uniref:hypothetical protein n=1 Tax=Alkalihalobacillus sp. LMS39 TaxID=2924032 RepID=UPI001FB26494|nr:hypothetical protein [Alkalihalobacillus sp. LMS39]UOE93349.1 hypothetical protein MM271_19460 [Alkalihalobacillus sp. LMS39]
MSKENNHQKDNVVLFPGLVTKLVDKGMTALKEKKFKDSLSFFEQALELEEDHAQGRFGVVLSLIELGHLKEAADKSKQMLNEDIGNYYDILQVHVSLLVQLGQYKNVVSILEGVLSEAQLPPHLAESFYQLLHFSRQMNGEEPEYHTPTKVDEEPPVELMTLLHHSNKENQLRAIQLLSKHEHPIVISEFKKYLLDDRDPMLKTIVLQTLGQLQVSEPIELKKFDHTVTVVPTQVKEVTEQSFGKEVQAMIEQELEQENPTLLETVLHIWWQYIFALFPLIPLPEDKELWVAAIYVVGLESQGFDFDENEIATKYHHSVYDILQKANEIREVEETVFQGIEV